MSASNGMRPVHPGEILREELEELGLSANALAKALDVPTNRVTAVLKGQRGAAARREPRWAPGEADVTTGSEASWRVNWTESRTFTLGLADPSRVG